MHSWFLLPVLLAAIFFVVPSSSMAQFDGISGGQGFAQNESIIVTPEFPEPGSTVTVRFESYGTNISGSTIIWKLDGVTIGDATNRREATFTAGALGKQHLLEIVVQPAGGVERVVRAQIIPTYIDIVIEPQTHVPDFYAGRAVPSVGSLVNATALIETGRPIGSDVLYTWRLNQKTLELGPIRGNNRVTFDATRDRNMTLSLVVSLPSGEVIGRRSILVPVVSPELQFYETNALYGINTYAVTDSFTMIGNSASLLAAPYYLDSRIYNNPTLHEWNISGERFSNNANPYSVTLEKTKPSGRDSIGFEVRDTTQLLQGARGTIQINY